MTKKGRGRFKGGKGEASSKGNTSDTKSGDDHTYPHGGSAKHSTGYDSQNTEEGKVELRAQQTQQPQQSLVNTSSAAPPQSVLNVPHASAAPSTAAATKRERIRLCLDAGSIVDIATSRKGMCYIDKCRHVVEFAGKEQDPLVLTEEGARMFLQIMSNTSSYPVLYHSETYVVESCPKDICSLSHLLNGGYKWIPSHGSKIVLQHNASSKDPMVFERAQDGLYYMEVELFENPKRTGFASRIGGYRIIKDENTESQSELTSDDTKHEPKERNADSQPNPNLTSKSERDVVVIDINRAHHVLNHPNETVLRAMAKSYGWQLTHTLDACPVCAIRLRGDH